MTSPLRRHTVFTSATSPPAWRSAAGRHHHLLLTANVAEPDVEFPRIRDPRVASECQLSVTSRWMASSTKSTRAGWRLRRSLSTHAAVEPAHDPKPARHGHLVGPGSKIRAHRAFRAFDRAAAVSVHAQWGPKFTGGPTLPEPPIPSHEHIYQHSQAAHRLFALKWKDLLFTMAP